MEKKQWDKVSQFVSQFVSLFTLLLLAMFGILTVINGINVIIAIRPIVGSLSLSSFSGIIHGAQFSRLTTLDILSHSSEPIVVQIVMIKLFAILINEIALLSIIAGIIAGLFAIKKVAGYLDAAGSAAK